MARQENREMTNINTSFEIRKARRPEAGRALPAGKQGK